MPPLLEIQSWRFKAPSRKTKVNSSTIDICLDNGPRGTSSLSLAHDTPMRGRQKPLPSAGAPLQLRSLKVQSRVKFFNVRKILNRQQQSRTRTDPIHNFVSHPVPYGQTDPASAENKAG